MAFNATSQVSYYYSPWQPGPGSSPFSSSLFVPSERNALSTESTWPPGPTDQRFPPPRGPLSPSASLLLCGSLDTLVYSFSEPGTGRQVSVIVSRVPRGRGEKRTCPRLGRIAGSGGPCWFSTKSTAPKMGPIVLLATESVTLRVGPIPGFLGPRESSRFRGEKTVCSAYRCYMLCRVESNESSEGRAWGL